MSECISNDANGNITITGDGIKTVTLNGNTIYDYKINTDLYRDLKAAVIEMCFNCPSGESTQGDECTSDSNCFVKQWRETLKKARGEQ